MPVIDRVRVTADDMARAREQGPMDLPDIEFVQRLREELFYGLGAEVEKTIMVAVAVAGGVSRTKLPAVLGSHPSIMLTDMDIRMALHRLKALAMNWEIT